MNIQYFNHYDEGQNCLYVFSYITNNKEVKWCTLH
jgi:hypothetical protein